MGNIITFEELKQIKVNSTLLDSAYSESFNKNYHNIFLSYSSFDKEYVGRIIALLTKNKGKVYTDEYDKNLPRHTNRKTAKILKKRIKKISKMIVFITTNSHNSKWIPWELGIADGSKNINDIAIFPSAEKKNDTKWIEQEYLGLYNRIEKIGSDFIVSNHKGKKISSLEKWINNG